MTTGRVILHLDLDCFYCQVEQKRLGIPREVPAAVQQWDGLIAINYAARALGVTRHMRVLQAMQFCPELKCLHVQTLGGETGQEGLDGPVNSGSTHPNDRLLQKACLERYRRASAEIIAVIRQLVPQATLEKASIDEVYVDVTTLVEKELMEREDAAVSEHAVTDAFAWGSIVEGGPLDTESELDRRLSVGASISCRIRGAIRDKLDFTSSVGIAHNKLLAKVGSARNKPDQQTIVTSRGITALMEDLPLKKLRNFGGKLGAELQALGATKIGQVAAMPMSQLQQSFGERAGFIADCVRGIDNEPVKERELTKSMLAYKSFDSTSDLNALNRWLGILADELSERLTTDAQMNQRAPRLLVLGYRQRGSAAGKSRSIPMPRAPPPGPSAAVMQQAAYEMLQKCADAFPCNNLGLTATDFQDLPGDEQGCITRFFQPKPNEPKTRAEDANKPAEAPKDRSESKSPSKPQKNMMKQRPKNTINSLFKRASAKDAAQDQQVASAPQNSAAERLPQCHTQRVAHDDISGANEGVQELQGEALHSAERPLAPHSPGPCSFSDLNAREAAAGRGESFSDQQEGELQAPAADHSHLQASESFFQQGQQESEPGARPDHGSEGLETSTSSSRQEPAPEKASVLGKAQGSRERSAPNGSSGPRGPEVSRSQGQKGSPGQGDGVVGVGVDHALEEAPGKLEDADALSADETSFLQGVDMKEQKRIMHEIWMMKNLRQADQGSKKHPRKPTVAPSGVAKQPRLTDMYSRRH